MAVTELHAALTTLKGALPSLEILAMADARRRELDAAIAGLTAEVTSLTASRVALRGQVETDTKAAASVQEKQARDYAGAINLAEEKIKDLQRSQQTAENQLAAVRAESARLKGQQTEDIAKTEAEFQTRLTGLRAEVKAEEEKFVAAQEQIKALHGTLAGVVAPQA
jgi:chromosome segregation ATPase